MSTERMGRGGGSLEPTWSMYACIAPAIPDAPCLLSLSPFGIQSLNCPPVCDLLYAHFDIRHMHLSTLVLTVMSELKRWR